MSIPVNIRAISPLSIRRQLDNLQSLPIVCVVNASHLPVQKTRGQCQWCYLYEASKGNQTTNAENVRLTFALTVLSLFMIFGIENFFLPFFLDLFLYTLEIN